MGHPAINMNVLIFYAPAGDSVKRKMSALIKWRRGGKNGVWGHQKKGK
jgi:hypothetical protein